jgi:hypothetical protein
MYASWFVVLKFFNGILVMVGPAPGLHFNELIIVIIFDVVTFEEQLLRLEVRLIVLE